MNANRIYLAMVREAIKPLFAFFERLGVHVTPLHYYQPIPDTRTLNPSLWERSSAMVGVDMDEAGQIELLTQLHDVYHDEYDTFSSEPVPQGTFRLQNGAFDAIDAEVLYAMVRKHKPRRIIEIGSGCSSLVISMALQKSAGETPNYRPQYIVIDPFPRAYVNERLPGLTQLIAKPIEDVPLSEFESLGKGDILFIDSTHVVRIGGDVNFEYLELLPRLSSGVLVHIHDVFLPAEYPKDLITKHHWFWTEQYLLQAFLTFNDQFSVLWAGNFMCLRHAEKVAAAFKSFEPHLKPGSFWIRRN